MMRGCEYIIFNWVRLGDTPAVIAGTPFVIAGTYTQAHRKALVL